MKYQSHNDIDEPVYAHGLLRFQDSPVNYQIAALKCDRTLSGILERSHLNSVALYRYHHGFGSQVNSHGSTTVENQRCETYKGSF